MHIQTDNLLNGQPCDNISEKNPYYSELTAMYWAWKNIKILYPDIKYIGLFHYRRYIAFDERESFVEAINKPESDILNYKIDSGQIAKIIDIIEDGKIILAHRITFPYSTAMQYKLCHFSQDLRVLADVIKNKFADYYPAFMEVMNGNKLFARNIFIMKYEDFCKYCEWLFAVFDEVDKRINYKAYYSPYQIRVPAFMSERLFNVYILKHGIKKKFYNLYFFGEGDKYNTHRHKIIYFIIKMSGWLRDEFTAALLRYRGKFTGLLKKIIRRMSL